MNKTTHLEASDGAELICQIEAITDKQFRVSSHAVLNGTEGNIHIESRVIHMCANKEEARIWMHKVAATRGFEKFTYADEFTATIDAETYTQA